MSDEAAFEEWAVLELMGHRRLGGRVSQATWPAGFARIDVYTSKCGDTPVATQIYGPSAIYCLTPTTEAVARKVGDLSQPAPVARWELPRGDEDPF